MLQKLQFHLDKEKIKMAVNTLNKIFINDEITVSKIGMTTLLFNNGLITSKTQYSIIDESINILEPVVNTLCLYYQQGNSDYYEYTAKLNTGNFVINGTDKFGNTLSGLENLNVLVFVDGYKLLPSEYDYTDNSITIHNRYLANEINKIVIYASDSIHYVGRVDTQQSWNEKTQTLDVKDFTDRRYMFFMNGQLLTFDKMTYNDFVIKFNVPIRPGIDILEYYRMPSNTITLLFQENPGYFSYGPKDDYQTEVPELYDTIVTFSNHIVRLSVDDIRPGFFVNEEGGTGSLLVVDKDYETKQLKCIQISPFSKDTAYSEKEFYFQVPQARSILKYISEFDLNGVFLPEILGIFQRLLLDESYDTIQRVKNIRSITKVDSQNINALINFLGCKLNITNMTIEEKHALLEELTNFYKMVGTKPSYNFYNTTTNTSRILKVEQLFTPIKDVKGGLDPIQRYVTFRTAEELGAKYQREYQYPIVDYGDVGTLANFGDSLTNMPRDDGILTDPSRPVFFKNTRTVYITADDGSTQIYEQPVKPNPYKKLPIIGPNQPTTDYGNIANSTPDNFIDYGSVSEEIKGKWIEWFEWDRPTNWYPTNHVNISVEVPAEIDYDTFMNEFKKTFYDISSAVLYIHNIIDVYTFGDDKLWEEGKQPNFGIMTSQLYHTLEYVFTNNPTIKAPLIL